MTGQQLSLFDLIAQPEPQGIQGEFILYFANMNGQGEHLLSQSLEFLPTDQARTQMKVFTDYASACEAAAHYHCQIGVFLDDGDREIYNVQIPHAMRWYLEHKPRRLPGV